VFPIARALFDETKALGGKPVMMIQGMKTIYDCATAHLRDDQGGA
jgi:hypothetical protein